LGGLSQKSANLIVIWYIVSFRQNHTDRPLDEVIVETEATRELEEQLGEAMLAVGMLTKR
jgi:hypothetical protein